LHDRLIDFFNCLPQVVRGEASLVIAALSGHEFIDLCEDFDLEYVARGLFSKHKRDWGALATRSMSSPCWTSIRRAECRLMPDYDAQIGW
jgi:hypothetical protein